MAKNKKYLFLSNFVTDPTDYKRLNIFNKEYWDEQGI